MITTNYLGTKLRATTWADITAQIVALQFDLSIAHALQEDAGISIEGVSLLSEQDVCIGGDF